MRTELSPDFLALTEGPRADAILRSCVHCGMCNATCPTYQVLGDELDGPRGRIYLMKEMFEAGTPNATARTHLDRCLTCRACETTCPSGVRYGELLEIGRGFVEGRPQAALDGTPRASLAQGRDRVAQVAAALASAWRDVPAVCPETSAELDPAAGSGGGGRWRRRRSPAARLRPAGDDPGDQPAPGEFVDQPAPVRPHRRQGGLLWCARPAPWRRGGRADRHAAQSRRGGLAKRGPHRLDGDRVRRHAEGLRALARG